MAQHPETHVRRAVRILLMVEELHKRGFQCLRAMPSMAPSGMYWRCCIGPAIFFRRDHGAILSPLAAEVEGEGRNQASRLQAQYSSGQDIRYFEWEDAEMDDARSLAVKFIARFALLARLGEGWDYGYVGCFQQLIGLAEAGWLPIVLSDYQTVLYDRVPLIDVRSPKQQHGPMEGKEPTLPAPPPGLLQQNYRP